VGERALAYYYLSCGACAECTGGHESRCVNLRGNLGVATDGGYAELAVLPAWNALAFPGEIDSVSATVLSDAVGTPVHVARRAHIAPGERVAVVGAGGGVGIHMAQVARAFGAEVAGLDITQAKLDFLERELGIPAVDSSDFGAATLPQAWSGKADVVVDFLGTTESLSWGWSHLGRGGRLVCLASFEGDSIPVDPRNLVRSELALLGSRYTSRYEIELAAKLVATGTVRPVITRNVGIDEVAAVHDELEHGTLIGRGALVW
jgi:propanol-preferring alcohol dehydrogenase